MGNIRQNGFKCIQYCMNMFELGGGRQRRGQTRIRSDGEHEAARIKRLRRLNGAASNARVQFFQIERQIHVTRSRGSQSAVRISACRH